METDANSRSVEDLSRPRGKKRRYSLDETLQLVIGAGYLLLRERGLSLGIERVSLQDAILEAGVPRTSAYRAFESGVLDPQANFRRQLVAHLLSDVASDSRDALADVFGNERPDLGDRSAVDLARIARGVIRRAGEVNLELALADHRAFLYLVALAAGNTEPDENPDMARILEANEEAQGKQYAQLGRVFATTFGLRLRRGMSWSVFGGLAASAAHGVVARVRYNPSLREISRPTGAHGETQVWSALAMNFESLVLMAFEADPDAERSADLRTWLEDTPSPP